MHYAPNINGYKHK